MFYVNFLCIPFYLFEPLRQGNFLALRPQPSKKIQIFRQLIFTPKSTVKVVSSLFSGKIIKKKTLNNFHLKKSRHNLLTT